MKLGVLALQGAVSEHLNVLNDLGVEGLAVRYAEELEDLDGLILPGGESTTLEKLMRRFGLDVALRQALERGMACWGTCAGMILLSQEIANAINETLRPQGVAVVIEAAQIAGVEDLVAHG